MKIPGVRYSFRQDWYVPTVDGIDLPVTTFDYDRAMELAVIASSPFKDLISPGAHAVNSRAASALDKAPGV